MVKINYNILDRPFYACFTSVYNLSRLNISINTSLSYIVKYRTYQMNDCKTHYISPFKTVTGASRRRYCSDYRSMYYDSWE